MLKKYNYALILLIIFQISNFSFGARPPRGYNPFYPETRRGNVTTQRPNLESRVGNPKETEFPQSRVGNIHIKSDKIQFPETKIENKPKHNTTRISKSKLKTQLKRVIRQTEDYEPPECANCLNDKYMKHYYAKGCKPIEAYLICKKPCPKYFECPKKQSKPSIEGCEYKGVVYNVDDDIPNENECLHCRCSKLIEPKIVCAVSECFGDWRPLNRSCRKVYKEGMCCSRIECLADDQLSQVKTCLYEDKTYKYGERIYPKQDKCLSCICGEKWNQSDPLMSEACKRIDCDFELENKWRDREGCVPIYNENTCCPIDYHCPVPKEWKCLFDGKEYEIGEKLITKDNCVDCVCRVPPDFTCIRQSCQSPPIRTNCTSIYETNKCCPTFNCTQTVATEITKILDKKSKTSEKNETQVIEEQKPGVVCPAHIPEGLSCAGTNCTTILDANGCQSCSCEIPCPQIECLEPCFIFAVTPGVCPQCSCPTDPLSTDSKPL